MPRPVSKRQQEQWERERLERELAKVKADFEKLKLKGEPPKPGETRTIEGEAAYPIYWIEGLWTCDKPAASEGAPTEGLPEGRMWNSSGCYRMFREVQSRHQMGLHLMEWWKDVTTQESEVLAGRINPLPATLAWHFDRFETWCGGWFTHWTYDVGQDNAAALASFERFVRRMEWLNQEETTYEKHTGEDGKTYTMDHPAYGLMGAEDRYRWRGSVDGNPRHEAPPPCRCEHCKKQGVIRISH